MPVDLIYLTMQGNTVSNTDSLNILFTFSNGGVTLTSPIFNGVYWGQPASNDPHQFYLFSENSLEYSGTIVNFYCEVYMNCETTTLNGTITVSQPVTAPVQIGSYAGNGLATLPAGQTQVSFQIPVGNVTAADAPSGRLEKPFEPRTT